ncbi:MAG: SsrA-binding protein SmpB [Candidatus Omnitrophica bacterium]|nr:SsrA-binding protein SmpB [Candidatus Omnitrophota bacterium]
MKNNNIAQNKKAHFDYILLDRFEAGVELQGPEVKSIRDRKVSIKESFVRIDGGQAYILGMHISPYKQSGQFAPDPTRTRRLLLHKAEIKKLEGLTAQKGHTVVPTRLYFRKGFTKIEIAVAKGKRLFDKRQKLRCQTVEREMRRSLKSR